MTSEAAFKFSQQSRVIHLLSSSELGHSHPAGVGLLPAVSLAGLAGQLVDCGAPESVAGDAGSSPLWENRGVTRFLLTLASLTAMIGMAAPAYADSTDDQFLAALGAAGITYPDPDKAIAAGKSVCKMLGDQGMNPMNVIIAIHNSNPRLQWDEAAKFTSIATDAYCPQT